MRVGLWLTLPLLVACAKEKEPAPTDLEDICRYIFANWEDEERVFEAHENLSSYIEDLAGSEEGADGLQLVNLQDSDLTDVEYPDRDLDGLLGVAGFGISEYPIDMHARSMLLEDQAWVNPVNYDHYLREIAEGDEDAFKDGEDLVRTVNDIQTKSWGVKIPYILLKDYRWVHGENNESTFLSRAWIEDRSCNEGGGNCLELSFAIDVWYQDGDKTLRMTAGWSEVTSSINLGDDLLIAGLAGGYQKIYEKTDEYFDENDI